MRLGTFEPDKIHDLCINLDPRANYKLPGKDVNPSRIPSMNMASIAGDPDMRPEGFSAEQWQNEIQKKQLIDPYFKVARDHLAIEKKLGEQRYRNHMMMGANNANK